MSPEPEFHEPQPEPEFLDCEEPADTNTNSTTVPEDCEPVDTNANSTTVPEDCEPQLVDPEHETDEKLEAGFVVITKSQKRRERSRRRASSQGPSARATLVAAADPNGLAGTTMAAIFVAIATGAADGICGDTSNSGSQRRARSRAQSSRRQQSAAPRAEKRASSCAPRKQQMPRGRR